MGKYDKGSDFVYKYGYRFNPDQAEPMLSIKPDYICSYLKFNNRRRSPYNNYVTGPDGKRQRINCRRCKTLLTPTEIGNHQTLCNSCINLTKNEHSPDLSKKARIRLLTAIDWLYLLAKRKTYYNEKLKKWHNFRVGMLTLSLPCEQLHDDLFIKNKMLNRFLTEMRRKYGMYLYAWRAEKKKNFTIHFHIIHDVYAHYKDINDLWNHILNDFGYIQRYRENQTNFHNGKFQYRKELSKTWNYYEQKKAYKKGLQTNWSNPTGTTDIHSLKKISNSRLYMGKYVSKKIEYAENIRERTSQYKQENNLEKVPIDIISQIEIEVKEQMTILGNIWYISQRLSKLKSIVSNFSDSIDDFFQKIIKESPTLYYKNDHCNIYKVSIRDIIVKNFTPLLNPIKDFIQNVREKYYLDKPEIFSMLGIPLKLY